MPNRWPSKFLFLFPNTLHQPLTRYTGFKERFMFHSSVCGSSRLSQESKKSSNTSSSSVTLGTGHYAFCLSSPWNPLDVLLLHTCRGRWGPDMMCGYSVPRCSVRTRSQGDKPQINHASPNTLFFPAVETFFSVFFVPGLHLFWVSRASKHRDSKRAKKKSAWRMKWRRQRAADRAGAIFGSTRFSSRLTLLPVTPCLHCETVTSASSKSADAAVPDLFKCIWLTPHADTSTQPLLQCGQSLSLGKHFYRAADHMRPYLAWTFTLQASPFSGMEEGHRWRPGIELLTEYFRVSRWGFVATSPKIRLRI